MFSIGSGDPSLGSERYDQTTTPQFIIKNWIEAIQQAGIRKCRGVIGDASRWGTTKSMITDGWTWNDIGYGYSTRLLKKKSFFSLKI